MLLAVVVGVIAATDQPPSICSSGERDGQLCASDHDCPNGICVVPMGVCGTGGGSPCQCPDGMCVSTPRCPMDNSLGTCSGGPFSGKCCEPEFHVCPDNGPCVASQKVCTGGGFFHGRGCLNDNHCDDGGVCRSTGQRCLGACLEGVQRGELCISDADCGGVTCYSEHLGEPCIERSCTFPGICSAQIPAPTPTPNVQVCTCGGCRPPRCGVVVFRDGGVDARCVPCLPPTECTGDCGEDREVTVEEILLMVDVATRGNPDCVGCGAMDPNRDCEVTVEEILTAVNHGLLGCPFVRACGGPTLIGCPPEQFCELPRRACATPSPAGECRARPGTCGGELDPVCGCDDQTYINDCSRIRAGVGQRYVGACGTEPTPVETPAWPPS